MRDRFVVSLGKKLMGAGRLRICIIDDQPTYFNDQMLAIARAAGFSHIVREYVVDNDRLERLLSNPPDIIILDIKGVTDGKSAKDGWGIAKLMFDRTSAYVVVTSAHRFFLHETHRDYDYLIEDRFLTGVDFVEELVRIADRYLRSKARFWAKPVFRLGLFLARRALIPAP